MKGVFKLGIIFSIKKSFKLKKIYKVLGEDSTPKEKALDELLKLCESDKYVSLVTSRYGANRDVLVDIYNKLLLYGAGQWADGHWVPASSLAYAYNIDYLLHKYYNNDLSHEIALRMVKYFQRGEVGPVDGQVPSANM